MFLKYWVERLETQRALAETPISGFEIKENQELSHLKTLKIWSNIKIIRNVI